MHGVALLAAASAPRYVCFDTSFQLLSTLTMNTQETIV